MPSGGKRGGSGRKPLDPFNQVTLFCVAELRKALTLGRPTIRARLRRQLKRVGPSEVEAYGDLTEAYDVLNRVPVAERRALIAKSGKDKGTLLDDVRHAKEQMKTGPMQTLAPLHPTDIGAAYREIARLARKKFGVALTARQVERRVRTFQKAAKTLGF
jgi:hypothetical protein